MSVLCDYYLVTEADVIKIRHLCIVAVVVLAGLVGGYKANRGRSTPEN